MNFKEKTVKENYLYKGKILNLRKDDVILPNGKTAIREIVEHSGGSAVLCVKDGKVLLVNQFRYPYKEEIWEIPAGKVNPGEDPMETALRELKEEGGITAKKAEKLFDVYPSPGYTEEVIRIYLAEGLTEGEKNLDEDEFLTGKWFDIHTLDKMVCTGEIKDAKTLIALFWLFKKEGRNEKD
ncbi:MAG: NUDIX hydrolase [Clostridia bacterium]|nr:NUDIX hydrolase [Clostridia bacterium]